MLVLRDRRRSLILPFLMEYVQMNRSVFQSRMRDILGELYPGEEVDRLLDLMDPILETYKHHETILDKRKKYDDRVVLNEDDAILITYADTIRSKGERETAAAVAYLLGEVTDDHLVCTNGISPSTYSPRFFEGRAA